MTYQQHKEKVREEAKQWQLDFANKSISWEELGGTTNRLYHLAKLYGLVKEFKENGIL